MRRARLPDTRSDEQRALELAYRHINRRERTVSEVRARLERTGLSGAPVVAALDELCQLGYLDDARYARVFVEDKRSLEGWGRERIERALLERGIDRDTVEAALTTAPDDDLVRAVALIERRFSTPPEELRDRQRALGMLLRKGYDSDTAYEAVRISVQRARARAA
jgi:regulatory protein